MKTDICIIIQGPSLQENILKSKNIWTNENIIFSCWEGEENLYEVNDKVIFNKIPLNKGVGNLFLQSISTYNGLLSAYNEGFKYVLKWRSDMIPTNKNKFLEIFDSELIFYFWHNYTGGYIVDYFMGGNIEYLLELWDMPNNSENNSVQFAEQALTRNFFKKKLNNKKYKFIGKNINLSNDIYWCKYNIFLSSYNNDSLFLNCIN